MGLREFVIDAWSWLSYKPVMAEASRPGSCTFPDLAASWLPDHELRRLGAYKVLAAYDNNQAGQLAALTGDENAVERRELGDAAKLVDTALGYLLGPEQHIVVEAANRSDGEAPSDHAARAADVQWRLRAWAGQELLPLRIQQAERNTVLLGDGVYVLAWEPSKQRPVVRTYDPGFYFPQWDEEQDDDFPTRVHLAWELPENQEQGLKPRLRRVTYELGSISEDGEAMRRYPWDPARPSATTCFLTDAEWLLEDLKHSDSLDRLPPDKASFRTRADGTVLNRLDLMIDFVPVVHVTNTVPAAGEHWGQSVMAKVLQGLDELAATDSDGSAASSTTGTPIIGLAGARLPVNRATGRPEPLTVRAGAVWQLGESGRMDTLDTSPQLRELRARVEHLLDRVASNSRITAAGMGTLDASQVPSGYALKLALGPLDALIGSMRLAREHKYRLLLKFVQRLFQAGHAPQWPAGPTYSARLVWAPHTPADRGAVMEEVVRGVEAEVLSLETGLRMLADAGYPIEDIRRELERVDRERARHASSASRTTQDEGEAASRGGGDGEQPDDPGPPSSGGSPGSR